MEEDKALTIAVINHNGREVLEATLDALQHVAYQPLELLLVDDGSTDGSDEWAHQAYPELRVIHLEPNAGRPSVVRNRALHEARHRYVLLLDHDVGLQPDAPAELMAAMFAHPDVAAVAPRLVYASEPDRLYGDGTNLHYLCVSGFNARDMLVDDRPGHEPFLSLAGGNVLFDRTIALQLGGFDENYAFGWGEDAELCLRCRLAGFKVLHVPTAVGRHVERPHGFSRAEAQFYNRYRMLFTIYSTRTLLILMPALLLFECCLLGLSTLKGTLAMHLRAIGRALRHFDDFRDRRHKVQATRMVSDTQIIEAAPLMTTGTLANAKGIARTSAMLQGLFNGYWRLVCRQLEA